MISIILSGCISTNSESGDPIGGVMKSVNGGKGFTASNTIDDTLSLESANVRSIAVDPVNTDIVYAGTDRKDLYYSTNGAQTWSSLPTGLSGIHNIAINSYNTQILYVSGMYEGRGCVVQTMDGGTTWKQVYVEPQDGTNITSMAISPLDGNVVYVGTSGGTIVRTIDAGVSWNNLYDAEDSVNQIQIDMNNVSTLYALIGYTDIIKSRDGGFTFESVSDMERDEEDGAYLGTLYSMAASPLSTGVVVVGTDQGVFRTHNYGKSWEEVDVIASTKGIPIHAIAINPHDPSQIVYAAAKAVYTSVSDGWTVTDTTSNRTVDVIAHDPANAQVIYLGLKKTE